MALIPYSVGMVQRVLPLYRAPFFEALGEACGGRLNVFAGLPRPQEAIETTTEMQHALVTPARNQHILRGGLYLCYQHGLINWLKDSQPEALVVEANPRYLSTPQAVRWMHAHHRPVIGWGLGSPAVRGVLAGVRLAFRRTFLSQFDALLTYSARGAEEYAAAGFPKERIFVAPNAAAPRPSAPPPVRPPVFDPAGAQILFVGRLQARKRVDVLLHACAALPLAQQPRLWIIGDGPERPALQALAQQVYPAAQFLGAIHGAALDAYFDAADLLVLPGTGGLAVQQAMAHALPVIVGEGDGTQSNLLRPQTGWQLAGTDTASLTACLSEALSDVPRLRRMGEAAYRVVAEEVNLDVMVAAFGTAIHSAVELLKG